ncbi:MAG: LysM peptidoglycan-binding domain-containing protein [Candidatus Margulisbacteria bacterium]|nr:LysM peptidoglycan-binding domain-containing protein [Candidatus Margulisiibacteriota bacterium]
MQKNDFHNAELVWFAQELLTANGKNIQNVGLDKINDEIFALLNESLSNVQKYILGMAEAMETSHNQGASRPSDAVGAEDKAAVRFLAGDRDISTIRLLRDFAEAFVSNSDYIKEAFVYAQVTPEVVRAFVESLAELPEGMIVVTRQNPAIIRSSQGKVLDVGYSHEATMSVLSEMVVAPPELYQKYPLVYLKGLILAEVYRNATSEEAKTVVLTEIGNDSISTVFLDTLLNGAAYANTFSAEERAKLEAASNYLKSEPGQNYHTNGFNIYPAADGSYPQEIVEAMDVLRKQEIVVRQWVYLRNLSMINNSEFRLLGLKYSTLHSSSADLPNIPGLRQTENTVSALSETARSTVYEPKIDGLFFQAILGEPQDSKFWNDFKTVGNTAKPVFDYTALEKAFSTEDRELFENEKYSQLKKTRGYLYALTQFVYDKYFAGTDFSTGHLGKTTDPRPLTLFKAYLCEYLATKGELADDNLKMDVLAVQSNYHLPEPADLGSDIWDNGKLTDEQKQVLKQIAWKEWTSVSIKVEDDQTAIVEMGMIRFSEGILLIDTEENAPGNERQFNMDVASVEARMRGVPGFDLDFYKQLYVLRTAAENEALYNPGSQNAQIALGLFITANNIKDVNNPGGLTKYALTIKLLLENMGIPTDFVYTGEATPTDLVNSEEYQAHINDKPEPFTLEVPEPIKVLPPIGTDSYDYYYNMLTAQIREQSPDVVADIEDRYGIADGAKALADFYNFFIYDKERGGYRILDDIIIDDEKISLDDKFVSDAELEAKESYGFACEEFFEMIRKLLLDRDRYREESAHYIKEGEAHETRAKAWNAAQIDFEGRYDGEKEQLIQDEDAWIKQNAQAKWLESFFTEFYPVQSADTMFAIAAGTAGDEEYAEYINYLAKRADASRTPGIYLADELGVSNLEVHEYISDQSAQKVKLVQNDRNHLKDFGLTSLSNLASPFAAMAGILKSALEILQSGDPAKREEAFNTIMNTLSMLLPWNAPDMFVMMTMETRQEFQNGAIGAGLADAISNYVFAVFYINMLTKITASSIQRSAIVLKSLPVVGKNSKFVFMVDGRDIEVEARSMGAAKTIIGNYLKGLYGNVDLEYLLVKTRNNYGIFANRERRNWLKTPEGLAAASREIVNSLNGNTEAFTDGAYTQLRPQHRLLAQIPLIGRLFRRSYTVESKNPIPMPSTLAPDGSSIPNWKYKLSVVKYGLHAIGRNFLAAFYVPFRLSNKTVNAAVVNPRGRYQSLPVLETPGRVSFSQNPATGKFYTNIEVNIRDVISGVKNRLGDNYSSRLGLEQIKTLNDLYQYAETNLDDAEKSTAAELLRNTDAYRLAGNEVTLQLFGEMLPAYLENSGDARFKKVEGGLWQVEENGRTALLSSIEIDPSLGRTIFEWRASSGLPNADTSALNLVMGRDFIEAVQTNDTMRAQTVVNEAAARVENFFPKQPAVYEPPEQARAALTEAKYDWQKVYNDLGGDTNPIRARLFFDGLDKQIKTDPQIDLQRAVTDSYIRALTESAPTTTMAFVTNLKNKGASDVKIIHGGASAATKPGLHFDFGGKHYVVSMNDSGVLQGFPKELQEIFEVIKGQAIETYLRPANLEFQQTNSTRVLDFSGDALSTFNVMETFQSNLNRYQLEKSEYAQTNRNVGVYELGGRITYEINGVTQERVVPGFAKMNNGELLDAVERIRTEIGRRPPDFNDPADQVRIAEFIALSREAYWRSDLNAEWSKNRNGTVDLRSRFKVDISDMDEFFAKNPSRTLDDYIMYKAGPGKNPAGILVGSEIGFRVNNMQTLGMLVINNGKILDAPCGEGKTIILQMAGMLKIFSGQKAIIVTSSEILASDGRADVLKHGGYFKVMLGYDVKVQHFNFDNRNAANAADAFAKSDFVYMSNRSLGFQLLSDRSAELMGLKTVFGDMSKLFFSVDEIDVLTAKQAMTPYKISQISGKPSALQALFCTTIDKIVQGLKLNECGLKLNLAGRLEVEDATKWADFVTNRLPELIKANELDTKVLGKYNAKKGITALSMEEFRFLVETQLVHSLRVRNDMRYGTDYKVDVDQQTRQTGIVLLSKYTDEANFGSRYNREWGFEFFGGLQGALEARELAPDGHPNLIDKAGLFVVSRSDSDSMLVSTMLRYISSNGNFAGASGTASITGASYDPYNKNVVAVNKIAEARMDVYDEVFATREARDAEFQRLINTYRTATNANSMGVYCPDPKKIIEIVRMICPEAITKNKKGIEEISQKGLETLEKNGIYIYDHDADPKTLRAIVRKTRQAGAIVLMTNLGGRGVDWSPAKSYNEAAQLVKDVLANPRNSTLTLVETINKLIADTRSEYNKTKDAEAKLKLAESLAGLEMVRDGAEQEGLSKLNAQEFGQRDLSKTETFEIKAFDMIMYEKPAGGLADYIQALNRVDRASAGGSVYVLSSITDDLYKRVGISPDVLPKPRNGDRYTAEVDSTALRDTIKTYTGGNMQWEKISDLFMDGAAPNDAKYEFVEKFQTELAKMSAPSVPDGQRLTADEVAALQHLWSRTELGLVSSIARAAMSHINQSGINNIQPDEMTRQVIERQEIVRRMASMLNNSFTADRGLQDIREMLSKGIYEQSSTVTRESYLQSELRDLTRLDLPLDKMPASAEEFGRIVSEAYSAKFGKAIPAEMLARAKNIFNESVNPREAFLRMETARLLDLKLGAEKIPVSYNEYINFVNSKYFDAHGYIVPREGLDHLGTLGVTGANVRAYIAALEEAGDNYLKLRQERGTSRIAGDESGAEQDARSLSALDLYLRNCQEILNAFYHNLIGNKEAGALGVRRGQRTTKYNFDGNLTVHGRQDNPIPAGMRRLGDRVASRQYRDVFVLSTADGRELRFSSEEEAWRAYNNVDTADVNRNAASNPADVPPARNSQLDGIARKNPNTELPVILIYDKNKQLERVIEPEASKVLKLGEIDFPQGRTMADLYTTLRAAQAAEHPAEAVKTTIIGFYGERVDALFRNLSDAAIKDLQALEWKDSCVALPAFKNIADAIGGRLAHIHPGGESASEVDITNGRMDVLYRAADGWKLITLETNYAKSNDPSDFLLAGRTAIDVVGPLNVEIRPDTAEILRVEVPGQRTAGVNPEIEDVTNQIRNLIRDVNASDAETLRSLNQAVLSPAMALLLERITLLENNKPAETAGQAVKDKYASDLQAAKDEYERLHREIAERHLDRLSPDLRGKLGQFYSKAVGRIDAAQGAFILGLALSAFNTFIRPNGEWAGNSSLEEGEFERRVANWLIGIPDNTGFGVMCSIRDDLATDISLSVVNHLLGGNAIVKPAELGALLFRDKESGKLKILKESLGKNAKGYASYLAVAFPALFLGGYFMEGPLKAINNPECLARAASTDPYEQMKFQAELSLACMSEGLANLAFEIPGMIMSAIIPSPLSKGVMKLVSLLRSFAGVGAVMGLGYVMDKVYFEPNRNKAFKDIDEERTRNQELGIAPPPALTLEEVNRNFDSLNFKTTVTRNAMHTASGVVLIRSLTYTVPKLLGYTGKVLPVAGQIMMGLQVGNWLASSAEAAFAPRTLEKDMQANIYASLDRSMTMRRFFDIKYSKGVRPMQFEVARWFEDMGFLADIRETLCAMVPNIQRQEIVEGFVVRSWTDKETFDAMWEDFIAALRSGDINAQRNFYNTVPIISDTVNLVGTLTMFGQDGDNAVVTTGTEGVQSKAKFFEFVMSNAMRLFGAKYPQLAVGSAGFLTDTVAGSSESVRPFASLTKNEYRYFLTNIIPGIGRDYARSAWLKLVPHGRTEAPSDAAFIRNMAKYGVTVDANTLRCARVQIPHTLDPLNSTNQKPTMKDLLRTEQPVGLFAANNELFNSFMTWAILERSQSPTINSRSYANDAILAEIRKQTDEKLRANPPLSQRELADFFGNILVGRLPVGFLGTNVSYGLDVLGLDPNQRLQEFFDFRLSQSGTFSVATDTQAMAELGDNWSLSRAGSDNAALFMESTLIALECIDGNTSRRDAWTAFANSALPTPPPEIAADRNELAKFNDEETKRRTEAKKMLEIISALIIHWSGANKAAQRENIRKYLNGEIGFAARLSGGVNMSTEYFIDNTILNRAMINDINRIGTLRSYSVRCMVSPEQAGMKAVNYIEQLFLRGFSVPEEQRAEIINVFLYTNGLNIDSVLQSNQPVYIPLDMLPPRILNQAAIEVKQADTPAQAAARAKEPLNGSVIPAEQSAVLSRSAKFNTTKDLLNNIYSDSDYLLSVMGFANDAGEQQNKELIRSAFQFLRNQTPIASRFTLEETSFNPGQADLNNYNKIRSQMIALRLIPENAEAAEVINVLLDYQYFQKNYAAMHTNETIDMLKGLGYTDLGQPPDITKVYLAYKDLVSAINTVCGTAAVDTLQLVGILRQIQQFDLVSANKADIVRTIIGTSFSGQLAECVVMLAEGKKPSRNNLQFNRLTIAQRNENRFPYHEEDFDAFLVLNNIATVNEIMAHRDDYGLSISWLLQKTDSLSAEAVQELAGSLYAVYVDNPAYRWKIESLVIRSPLLMQTLLLTMGEPARQFVQTCVSSRMRFVDPNKRHLEQTVAGLRNSGKEEQSACADYLQTLLDNLLLYVDGVRTVVSIERPETYTVVSGDNLSRIGQKFGLRWQDIARLNNISEPYIIHPGQALKLPAGQS